MKVFDEHYYNSIEWACEQHYRFDNYKRGVADLSVSYTHLGENKYSMLVNVTEDIANHPDALILNRGYYGMNLKTDRCV